MRKLLAVTALAAFVTGSAFLSTGTASAATTLAGTCAGSVNGNMGDTVGVQGSSVKEFVRQGAKDQVNVLTFATVWPDALADNIAGKGVLAVGTVPNSAGGTITGDAIGTVVSNALKGAAGLGLLPDTQTKVLNSIKSRVAQGCGLTTLATNYVAPGSTGTGTQQGGGTAAAPGGTSGNLSSLLPGNGNGSGTGTVPMRDYSGIPAATAGTAVAPGVRYPADGTLPGDASAPQAGQGDQTGQSAGIRDAGNAQSLSSPGGSNDVQLPMLLAVIVLAGVTAGLVRTWVLRRAG